MTASLRGATGRAITLRLLLLAGLLLYLFFGDPPERSHFWSAFFDAGHTALFGAIALLIRGLLLVRPRLEGVSTRRTTARIPLLAFALTVLLGAITEILQVLQRRGDPSVSDLLRDTAGAAAFLIIAGLIGGRAGSRSAVTRKAPNGDPAGYSPAASLIARVAAVAAALALLFAAGWTLIQTSAAYLARDRAFPTLFALDGSWWEREFIVTGANELTAGGPAARTLAPGGVADSSLLARLDLRPRPYSGLTLEEPHPDWRGYKSLVFTVVSDLDRPLPMAIRVHDAAHDGRYGDRFNRRLLIQPGINRIVIPIDDIRNAPDRRKMDLRRIKGILLFAYHLTRRTHVYLGPLRLE